MAYLPEICIGQKYLIDGNIFILFDIRATNIDSPNEFVIACRFKAGDGEFFEENIKRVIDNHEFELID